MKAFSLIRPGPEYRRDAFAAGLKAIGFDYAEGWQGQVPARDDVLLIWNRYASFDHAAATFERAGAAVLVAENGYIGNDEKGRQHYALARNGHNGSGTWFVGNDDRWGRLGVPVQAWREQGRHVLIIGQRSIGSPTMASPVGWEEKMAAELRRLTRREVRIRHHPEHRNLSLRPRTTLEDDLRHAWAVVTWASGAGVRALVSGIPVFFAAPHWIAAGGASRHWHMIENPPLPDRMPALRRLAWAQWTLDEISTGLPFRYLLGNGEGLRAA
jgi:hypothetical protein